MKYIFSTKATSQSHAGMNLATACESKTQSLYEEMGGNYTLADGMYYPDLALPEDEPHYGKYGRMRLRHLKEHRKVLYNTLLLDGELIKHLNEVDDTANQRMDLLTLQMQEQQGVNEALKARDQMAWVDAMNNIRNAVEELVLSELIFY